MPDHVHRSHTLDSGQPGAARDTFERVDHHRFRGAQPVAQVLEAGSQRRIGLVTAMNRANREAPARVLAGDPVHFIGRHAVGDLFPRCGSRLACAARRAPPTGGRRGRPDMGG